MDSSIDSSRPTIFRRSQTRRIFDVPCPHGLEEFGNTFAPDFRGTSRGTTRDNIALLLSALPPKDYALRDVEIGFSINHLHFLGTKLQVLVLCVRILHPLKLFVANPKCC